MPASHRKRHMKLIGVLAAGDDRPLASFDDMPTALAWGLQQFKGKPFVVRILTAEGENEAEVVTSTQEGPAVMANAVSTQEAPAVTRRTA